MKKWYAIGIVLFLAVGCLESSGQSYPVGEEPKKSIGGNEHDSEIYGVKIGMNVESALRAVFINADRLPGQEKPDALRREGRDKKNIRVLYKSLPKGELQIVFDDGEWVSQVVLTYRVEPILDDLRLPYSASIGSTTNTIYNTSATQSGVESPALNDGSMSIEEFGAKSAAKIDAYSAKKIGNVDRSQSDLLDGARYDDRYSVGYTDNLKLQKIWWRDEKTAGGYSIRVAFLGKKRTAAGGKFVPSIVRKIISLAPRDEGKYLNP